MCYFLATSLDKSALRQDLGSDRLDGLLDCWVVGVWFLFVSDLSAEMLARWRLAVSSLNCSRFPKGNMVVIFGAQTWPGASSLARGGGQFLYLRCTLGETMAAAAAAAGETHGGLQQKLVRAVGRY